MSEQSSLQNAGWSIGESIALELDVALSIARGQHPFVSLPASLATLVQSLPPDIPAELQDMLVPSLRINTLLEYAAYLAGVLLCADYRAATVPMRELDSATALSNLVSIAAPLGLLPDEELPVDERLIELWRRVNAAGYARLGIEVEAHERYAGAHGPS